MNQPIHRYVFGYGSLVNRATHDYHDPHRAELHGWRRVWRHTALRDVAFLTVVPQPGATTEGLIARVPDADWGDLDHRERAYERVTGQRIEHPISEPTEIAVYTIPAGKHAPPTRSNAILLSYLDTVVEGFLAEYGTKGVQRFFATTEGWDAPVLNDRARPRYSRHRSLAPATRAMVDRELAALPSVVQELE
ncbi:MAG: gamma-glutamylcyclotransferase family protein [Pseudomonadota bacterium]